MSGPEFSDGFGFELTREEFDYVQALVDRRDEPEDALERAPRPAGDAERRLWRAWRCVQREHLRIIHKARPERRDEIRSRMRKVPFAVIAGEFARQLWRLDHPNALRGQPSPAHAPGRETLRPDRSWWRLGREDDR